MTITLKDEDRMTELTVKFNYIDVTVEDVYRAIEGLLVSYGFALDSIKQFYLEKSVEIQEEELEQNTEDTEE